MWSVAPTTRGLIGDPRAALAVNNVCDIRDTDKYEDQPFVILELLEVTREPQINPG